MAAKMDLVSCKMQIKTKAGALDSGKDKVKSITLAGVDENAAPQLLLDVAGAVGSVIANPVLETYRIDSRLVSDGE